MIAVLDVLLRSPVIAKGGNSCSCGCGNGVAIQMLISLIKFQWFGLVSIFSLAA